MPDTIEIERFLDSLPPDIRSEVEKTLHQSVQQSPLWDILPSLIFILVILLYGFITIRSVLRQKNITVIQDQNAAVSAPGHLVYYGDKLGFSDADITSVLLKYCLYYVNLQPDLQCMFRKRLNQFMQEKVFIICAEEGFREMPVLSCAAAVQLTFGLDKFLLPWFRFIKIHIKEYFGDDSLKILAGDVEGNTITIAWNQFIKGNQVESDGENVGLHEMAHALYYQHLVADQGKEKMFRAHYDMLMKKGEEIYDMHNNQRLLFSGYAYKNLQEFWAESVEIFFEKPGAMQVSFPDLFIMLKELLRQNPLNRSNPRLID